MNTFSCLPVYYASFFNQPEMPYHCIQDYSSPQLCSLMIEMITWNLFDNYSELLRVMDLNISNHSQKAIITLTQK